MDTWIWLLLAGASAVIVMVAWWRRRARREYVLNHVRVELHPPRIVEDRVIEQVWRAAISMTNTSRRPCALPTFAERATVHAARCEFLARVYLDENEVEVNPGEVSLAWVEFELPRGLAPVAIRAQTLCAAHSSRPIRFATSSMTSGRRSTASRFGVR